MRNLGKYTLQAFFYALFCAAIGWFSASPSYVHMDPNLALIKLSFTHAGEHKEDCRQLTPEELAELAPNMRRPMRCSRERVPLLVELDLDDKVILRRELPPSGLSRDGISTVYQRFPVSPGEHRLTVRLRDSRREEGFDHERSETVRLSARRNLVIDFNPEAGGFVFL